MNKRLMALSIDSLSNDFAELVDVVEEDLVVGHGSIARSNNVVYIEPKKIDSSRFTAIQFS